MDFSRTFGPEKLVQHDGPQYVVRQSELSTVLAFARRSIDDVINCPIARRDVYNWFKTGRRMQRWIEVSELERQWNGVR